MVVSKAYHSVKCEILNIPAINNITNFFIIFFDMVLSVVPLYFTENLVENIVLV